MESKVSGDFIRKLRRKRLLTQEELAEACGFHLRTLQRIENTGFASIQSIRAIAKVLNVDPAVLTTEFENDGSVDSASQMMATTKKYVGIALLWVALSALVYVPTSDGGSLSMIIAGLGFLSFAAGLLLIGNGLRQSGTIGYGTPNRQKSESGS